MAPQLINTVSSTLPTDDHHPYRTGAWRPQVNEWNDDDLVVEGSIPDDLEGVYLRNTENPIHDAIGMYHPFDGDAMLHAIAFGGGTARYRNRFVQTDGLAAERDAAESLWAGFYNVAGASKRTDGWGARGRMKDASSTDVIVHNGVALTSFWQCGDVYQLDPITLDPRGKASWVAEFPNPVGVSAHTKLDENTGELLIFGYSAEAPFQHYGVVSADGQLVHSTDVALPGPRLPHDIAFTENYTVFNDLPMFWNPDLLSSGVHLPTFYPELPTRLGVVPRFGTGSDVIWFEADPTYVLHWINAYEDGDEIVVDGFFQHDPDPAPLPEMSKMASLYRYLDLSMLQARPHRWRLNLRTGECREEPLSERVCEFAMIDGRRGGRPYEWAYSMTAEPGMFLFNGIVKHNVMTGAEEVYQFPPGVYASETPFAPRVGSTSEDDGYLVTFTSDVNNDESHCVVFDAQRLKDGPIARIRLPERISSGTHSTWTPSSALLTSPG